MLQELHSTGVDLYLHQQGINTTTLVGKGRIREPRVDGIGMLRIAREAGCGAAL
ncbi:MAG: hypothetical protein LH632_13315 [Rhodoferax sp.]|nr:hypothetical protein [Rhodoferax sp.]